MKRKIDLRHDARRHTVLVCCLAFWNLVIAGHAMAQVPVPAGPQFQINTYDSGEQEAPAVAASPTGDFVMVWQSDGSSGDDISLTSIQAQRFASDGSVAGGEFQVNVYTTGDQLRPAVAMADSGDFVVAWRSDESDNGDPGPGIQARRFDASGSPIGGQFRVNSYVPGVQSLAAVAAEADGGFLVSWQSTAADADPSETSVHAQRFASDGSAVGSQFQINEYTTGQQRQPSLTVLENGDFVVVWDSAGSAYGDDIASSVQARRFASDGNPLAPQFQVNTYTSDSQRRPRALARPDGGFLVVWDSLGSNGDDTNFWSVQGQLYASNGSSIGSQFQINAYTNGSQKDVRAIVHTDGSAFVVWQSDGREYGDPSDTGIHGRRVSSDGQVVGPQILINSHTTGRQDRPDIAALPDQGFVVVWPSFRPGADEDSMETVQAQRFSADGIFVDAFESQGTGFWTLTVGQ